MVERGTVDGLGWPLWGIEAWGWHKVLKYRVDPGFYSAEVSVLVNNDTWKKLSKAQQDVVTGAMLELEEEFPKIRAANDAAARKIQADAGIQVIQLPPAEAAKWLKVAEDAGWEDVLKKDPQNGPRIRELTTRK
jgi:TRAP-type C4-dicarboxylate transport system substrate-binding protein